MTRDSSAPTPHCVRRGWVCMGNHRLRLGAVGAVGFASARRLCSHAAPTSNEMSVCCNARCRCRCRCRCRSSSSSSSSSSCACACAFGYVMATAVPSETEELKRRGRFCEVLFGARSVAGSMMPLSLAYAGARTQIPDAPLPAADHGPRLALAG